MWPSVKHYDQDHLLRIALPLGGIGTGTVSLGGRGDLRDWEIMQRPAKRFIPYSEHSPGKPLFPFFALRAESTDGTVVTRALEGVIEPSLYEGAAGCAVPNHGIPRFRSCSLDAAYPFGQVHLSDPDVPLTVRLEAFNPLIPGDADRSSIPAAVLRYVLFNPNDSSVTASVCGSVPNFIGINGLQCNQDSAKGNYNSFRAGDGVSGILMQPGELDSAAETWGTIALATTARDGISFRTRWITEAWGGSLLDFWDDFSDDGMLDERDGASHTPMSSLSAQVEIPAGESRAVTFLLAWHFPNRYTWTPREEIRSRDELIGNYYAAQYSDAWDVAERTAAELPQLEADTLRFVNTFCESSLPAGVKEAALFNLSTLRSQTCFRTPDGRFYGFEGCGDTWGSCYGSCTHVWNYEQALAFLFGDLAMTMREVEFAHATDQKGCMSFRVNLPLDRSNEFGKAAADGQMGCIMKLYRDWQLSGDDGFLLEMWPKARKALEFCWIPGGWDADKDGVMEGCQHNTMDVEYYGPNPQMGSWYLGALRAAEEMARYLGDAGFADTCCSLFEHGSEWMDDNLFNGDYYEHKIQPLKEPVPEAFLVGMGSKDSGEPALQLGTGCLVDQLVGQYMAHICGLGYLLQPGNVQETLKSIIRNNFREGFHGHFNNMRSYVLGDESALLMATYPRGGRPLRPMPYYNEVMTGFEYTAAVHMLYEGQIEEGLRIIRAIRERYDGLRRSPFDEAECGHHYARAMASWGAVLALTCFHYSAVSGVMRLADKEGQWFWSTGHAWGTCTQTDAKVELSVMHGELYLTRFILEGGRAFVLDEPRHLAEGDRISWTL